MRPIVRKLLKVGKMDREFLDDLYAADGDTKPSIFASDMEIMFFTAVYYGWLVGKFGNDWRVALNNRVK